MDTNIIQPEITVLMPAYNAERFIALAIESVLCQSYGNFELLIIDDGSNDNTQRIIENYSDSRIRLLINQKNLGLVAVRNQGIKECRGKYIALLDADDIALPARFEQQKKFLDTHPTVGLIGSAVALINEKGAKKGVTWKSGLPTEEISIALLFRNQFAQSSIMARREILEENPYTDGFAPAEDYELWSRIAKKSSLWNLPKTLVLYRVHNASSSKKGENKKNEAVASVRIRELQNIGILASTSELDIHARHRAQNDENIREFLTKKATWLTKLMEANSSSKKYPEALFARGMGREWLDTAYANSKYGLTVWKIFHNSPLSKEIWSGKTKKLFKFFIKTLLRLE